MRYLIKLMKNPRQDTGRIVYNVHQVVNNAMEFMVDILLEDKESFLSHNVKPEVRAFKKYTAKAMLQK
jgi:quinol monooxygenase YgiN